MGGSTPGSHKVEIESTRSVSRFVVNESAGLSRRSARDSFDEAGRQLDTHSLAFRVGDSLVEEADRLARGIACLLLNVGRGKRQPFTWVEEDDRKVPGYREAELLRSLDDLQAERAVDRDDRGQLRMALKVLFDYLSIVLVERVKRRWSVRICTPASVDAFSYPARRSSMLVVPPEMVETNPISRCPSFRRWLVAW